MSSKERANDNMETPAFVRRDGIIADSKYVEWLGEIKQRYQRSQIKASVQINHTMLEFYWELGRDIVALKAESKWGTGVLQQLSLDLRKMFPGETGFSYRNIRYMRQWYLFYYEQVTKWQQVAAKITTENLAPTWCRNLAASFCQIRDAC